MQKRLLNQYICITLIVLLITSSVLVVGLFLSFRRATNENLTRITQDIIALEDKKTDISTIFDNSYFSTNILFINPNSYNYYTNNTLYFSSLLEDSNFLSALSLIEENKSSTYKIQIDFSSSKYFYLQQYSDNFVIVVGQTCYSFSAFIFNNIWLLLISFILTIIIVNQLIKVFSRKTIMPLDNIDIQKPLQSDTYEEFAPMLRRIDANNRSMQSHMNRLSQRQAELNAILNGLQEGLVVLDERHHILIINPAASAILSATKGKHVGKSLFEINRNETLMKLVNEKGGIGELTSYGRIYRVSASLAGDDLGIVMLLQDVTEERMAELNRQQFSANVSHELRTPLTTISGYAELLATGMANPADTANLATKIHQESKRMLSLIEDIIRLSKLDEGAVGERQPIDLLLLAQSCASKLMPFALKQNVSLSVQGENSIVYGDRTLLEEMIENLIGNAIKYNNKGGSVLVKIGKINNKPNISVSDTGVGIPQEHQTRVFERFYRVDNSRSKDTGGTGLGLSIVKHGAKLHNAAITLQSELGKGTTIELLFPLQNEEN